MSYRTSTQQRGLILCGLLAAGLPAAPASGETWYWKGGASGTVLYFR